MTATSEAIIKAARNEDDDGLQEFCHLYDELELGPDADRKLEQVRIVMQTLIMGGDIKDAPDPEDDEDNAARELANAFATIEQHAAYLPKSVYNAFVDWSADFLSYAQWDRDPELLRTAGPHIVRAAIKKLAAKESY